MVILFFYGDDVTFIEVSFKVIDKLSLLAFTLFL